MSYIVEIFNDYDAHTHIDTAPALAGVAIIGAFSSTPESIIAGNALKITRDPSDDILSRKIRWPKNLQADLNIVLTDRAIRTNAMVEVPSISRVSGAARLAIVSAVRPDAVVAEVTAHEFGHLLDIPYPGHNGAHVHCKKPRCIMHETVRSNTVRLADTSTFINKVRSLFAIPKKVEHITYTPTAEFCDDCALALSEQLGKMSTRLTTE